MLSLNEYVWYHIALRLSDTTLLKLTHTSIWNELLPVLRRSSFWYERTEILALSNLESRSDVDWKRVYYSLVDSRARALSSRASVVDYLPALLVHIEIGYAPLTDFKVWSRIGSVEVLNYLLSIGLEVTADGVSDALATSARLENEEMVRSLLLLASKREDLEEDLSLADAIDEAISSKNIAITQLLLTEDNEDFDSYLRYAIEKGAVEIAHWLYCRDDYSANEMIDNITLAIQSGDPSMLELVLDKMECEYPGLGREVGSALFLDAVQANNVAAIDILAARDMSPSDTDLSEAIATAVQRDMLEATQYLLKLRPTLKLDSNLLLHAAKKSRDMFRIVLADERVDPNLNLTKMISSLLGRRSSELSSVLPSSSFSVPRSRRLDESCFNLLVQDSRFEIERLNIGDVRSLVWCLQDSIADNVLGFTSGGTRAGGTTNTKHLGLAIEGKSIYSLLLRYLVLKRPSAQQLVQWMISLEDETLVLAARWTIGEHSEIESELAPIKAIMLLMLHPGISFDDILLELEEEGIKQADRVLAGRLVGAWMGGQR